MSAALVADELTVDGVFDGISLAVDRGQLVLVDGPSGSGKSLLLRALAGLATLDHGVVTVAGTALGDVGEVADRPVLVPQEGGLVPTLTALESVSLPLQARQVRPAEAEQRARSLLDLVGLSGCSGRIVAELSGGQRRRVSVARGLVAGPAVLLLDDPTEGLDRENREAITTLLAAALERGSAIVAVSEEPALVEHAVAFVHL